MKKLLITNLHRPDSPELINNNNNNMTLDHIPISCIIIIITNKVFHIYTIYIIRY